MQPLLRFLTCGSVDDGKSSLIGRLLYESGTLYEDQLAAVTADSRRWGTQGEAVDLALLVDGLAAEREQGITIDVAYRYFSTPRRKFIVADTPGHEQYTRNMVTGASTASLAVILVDARKGVLVQTRRHSLLCGLMGVRHVVLAVNKMDLADYAQAVFNRIDESYRAFAQSIGLHEVTALPLSAVQGDNVTRPSERMPWYQGPTLLDHLERVDVHTAQADARQSPLRLPVQWVNRPHADFRGYCGRLVGGQVRPGDRVIIQPSGRLSQVERIVAWGGDRERAQAGESVTLTLADDVDVSRGDVICGVDQPAPVSSQFECTLVWLAEAPMLPGRHYLLKLGTQLVGATVTALKHRLNINTQEQLAAKTLELNDIGTCHLTLDRDVVFEPYAHNRDLGGFILIDRIEHHTVGAGMLSHSLRPASRVRWHAQQVNRLQRQRLNGHGSAVLWFTGLSASGKSTVANLLAQRLHAAGVLTYVLDGDNVRHGLSKDLGFTDADRVENIRRAAEVAKLMVDAGVVVMSAFISPFRAERELARELFSPGEFIEVHVDVPLSVAESRDPKGLYRLARAGQLKRFTGIDSPYEPPVAPEVRVDASATSAEDAAEQLHRELLARGLLSPPAG
jgi:bifunctional enzyme CysN/CysC